MEKIKYCIFENDKICDNCNECMKCDLNPNKICNNCGKCLEMDGVDIKAIKIDEIIDNKNDSKEIEDDPSIEDNSDFSKEDSEVWDLIDDIAELNNISSENRKGYKEAYPGLILKESINSNENSIRIQKYKGRL